MIWTRRWFLNRGLTLLGAGATAPRFIDRTATALAEESGPGARRRNGGDHRVLVVLQLAGGNDGLNTVAPFRSDDYRRARPTLALPADRVLRLDDEFALHPEAAGLKRLYDDGLLAVVHGAGYPNPNRSHFISTDVWETADPSQRSHQGWLGRYFDCTCDGRGRTDPRAAVALTGEAPLSLVGAQFDPVSFRRPDQLTWYPGRVHPAMQEAYGRLNEPAGEQPGRAGAALSFLQRTALDARLSAHEIQEAAGGAGRRGRDGASGPGGFPRNGTTGLLGAQLGMIARMIAAPLPTRVYYASLGGFDTHANQTGTHDRLMRELGGALAEFFDDLRRTGQLDRVLLMTFSEFGRRVEQNASGGTDHGAAAPMFLLGRAVRPGLHGAHPDLRRLDAGDLRWTVDFRSVYQGVLTDWLRADSRRVLGGVFPRLNVIRPG